MSELKPVKCRCGKDAEVHYADETNTGITYWWVECATDGRDCWSGPVHDTEGYAIRAWNAVMGGDDD